MIKLKLEQEGELSPYVCVLACQSAYAHSYDTAKNKLMLFSSDWEEFENTDSSVNNHDYRGVAYINHQQKHVLIAHRGTEPDHLLTWANTNFPLVGDAKIPESYFRGACDFSRRVREKVERQFSSLVYNFVETGHSLGGMYAALNSYVFNSRAISFDSPALGHILHDSEKCRELSGDKQKRLEPYLYTNYVTAPDLVNTAGKMQYGTWIRLYTLFQRETQATVNNFSNLWGVTSFFKTVALQPFQYSTILHSIAEMVAAFDPKLGVPYLQSQILSWPHGSYDYFWWQISTSRPDLHAKEIYNNDIIGRNHRYEEDLAKHKDYRIGNFLVPQFVIQELTTEETRLLEAYVTKAEERYKIFYKTENEVFYNLQKEWQSMKDPSYLREENYQSIQRYY